jgi:transcriptional regulator with XRE-family HTH domain
MLQISKNIKTFRELSGKSQQQMAELLGVKRTTYANWETNTEPELTKLMEIAKIFGVDYTRLISDSQLQEQPTAIKQGDVTMQQDYKNKYEQQQEDVIAMLKEHYATLQRNNDAIIKANEALMQHDKEKASIMQDLSDLRTDMRDIATKMNENHAQAVRQILLELLPGLAVPITGGSGRSKKPSRHDVGSDSGNSDSTGNSGK